MLSIDDIRLAQERIRNSGCEDVIHTRMRSIRGVDDLLSARVGRNVRVFFKCEHEQPVGSFKIRGALNFILSCDEETRANGFVTHSSGNHGLAVAAAAQFVGTKAVIVVPRNAPAEKIALIAARGAEIVECEPTLDARQATCRELCTERHMTEIPPFNHLKTMAGQGTLGLEILEQVPDVDVVLAAVGGCGMISGIATAIKASNSHVAIVGVEPAAVDDTIESLKCGDLRGPSDPSRTTICDALRVSPPGNLCFPIVQKLVDHILPVEDDQVIDAMSYLWRFAEIVTEPSGACSTAALFSNRFEILLRSNSQINTIVVIICGCNVSQDYFVKLISCR